MKEETAREKGLAMCGHDGTIVARQRERKKSNNSILQEEERESERERAYIAAEANYVPYVYWKTKSSIIVIGLALATSSKVENTNALRIIISESQFYRRYSRFGVAARCMQNYKQQRYVYAYIYVWGIYILYGTPIELIRIRSPFTSQ